MQLTEINFFAILMGQMNFEKLEKNKFFQIGFIVAITIFAVIALNLSVGWFTIVMPIVAALILFMIFQVKD